MPKAAVLRTLGIRLETKLPASSAGLTAPPTSCGFPVVSVSPGTTTTLSVSTRMPERKPGCSISARPERQLENRPGKDVLWPSGNMHPEDEEAERESEI